MDGINPLVGGFPVNLGFTQNSPSGAMDKSTGAVVIDGTPMRVVTIALAAAVSIVALKWAGFRFNVGVSS